MMVTATGTVRRRRPEEHNRHVSALDDPILFFFTDQQRADTVGCYGIHRPDAQPRRDGRRRRPRSGARRSRCGPARALQTGVYPGHRLLSQRHPLAKDATTIAHLLKRRVRVSYIGKWHLANLRPTTIRRCRQSAVAATRTTGWGPICSSSARTPMAAATMTLKGALLRFNRTASMPGKPRDRLSADAGRLTPLLSLSVVRTAPQNDLTRYVARWVCRPLPGAGAGPGRSQRRRLGRQPADYNLQASTEPGRVLAELEQLGRDNTLVIYTSDHGSHFRTRNSNTSALPRGVHPHSAGGVQARVWAARCSTN